MGKQELTIETVNENIVRSVAKKALDLTSLRNMPFEIMTFTPTKNGYGFTLYKKDKNILLSVRSNDALKVHVRNRNLDYATSYPISDITMDKIPTESAVEAYKKYCTGTIYTIMKTWLDTPDNKKPELGEWHLYKY